MSSLLLLSACATETEQKTPEGDLSGGNDTELTEPEPKNNLTYPLYLTTMTHMEGDFTDDENEIVFKIHVEELRFGMDLAEEYGAILTIETEKPFAKANTLWDLNIMKEVLDRGHGVGTHCDVGGPKGEKLDPKVFAEQIKENKSLVDALVGAENNRGCSGAGGYSDWAQAMVLAGFDYVNGIVGMHLLAVPQNERPMAWTDRDILKGEFHSSFPDNLLDRVTLFQLEDTMDWQADETGIVVSSGEMGRFDGLAEGGFKNSSECPNQKCAMTMEDVDQFVALVEEVNAERDPSQIAKLTLYFPVNNFEPENEAVLRAFFEAAQTLQNDGEIVWASQWDVVESYLNSL